MPAVDVYDYALPPGAIAQEPAEPRSEARLLVGLDGEVAHRRVADLPALLGPGDLVVVNETKVIPARLRLQKEAGGHAEVLLLEAAEGGGADEWLALVRPGRRLPPGTRLYADGVAMVEVGGRGGDGGQRLVRLLVDEERVFAACGEVPLPPYIHTALDDPNRYQTVFATSPGSVAAPTAGLHLTEQVLDAIRDAGAVVEAIDLTVGLDTFKPISTARVEDHTMHSERYRVPEGTLEAARHARRVIAVGTTTVRALEAAARGPLAGRTDLFITPGFEFRVVDLLLTNFHMPRSSLLVLLAAFAGERWRALYDVALDAGYRFLSFGDAMLVNRA